MKCAMNWLTLALCVGVAPVAAGQRANVVLIVADDLGYGELGCQGNKQIPTPHIDSIAADGVRFSSGYVSCPVCSPTRAGMLTGRYQQRFGHEFNPGPNAAATPTFGLSKHETTLQERLKAAGYTTGMVGKWHLGFIAGTQPIDRGFGSFYGFLGGAHSYLQAGSGNARRDVRRGTESIQESEYLTDAFAREAVAFIDANQKQPFFLYLPFNAVHNPLETTEKYRQRVHHISDPKRQTFAAMLVAMDDAIGKVLAKLNQCGLDESTIVFFISDNGGPTPQTTSSNHPLRATKGTVYEGGVRVPFAIRWKGKIPAGKVDDRPVSSLDIHPTALAAAGVALDPTCKLDGVNLLPYLSGEKSERPHEALYWRYGEQSAIRSGDWKLLVAGRGEEPVLYNLADDIGEQKDVAKEHPAVAAKLRDQWQAWNSQLQAPKWQRANAKAKNRKNAKAARKNRQPIVQERAPSATRAEPAKQRPGKPPTAGPNERGFLLPNGWTLTPAGEHVQITDLPLNIIPLADGRHALVSCNGYNDHILYLIDLATKKPVAQATVRQSWFGLAFDRQREQVWWAGGGANVLHRYKLADNKLDRVSPIEPDALSARIQRNGGQPFNSGLVLDGKRNLIFSLNVNNGIISALDTVDGSTKQKGTLGGRPYDVVVGPQGRMLYVSDWSGRQVLVVHPEDLRTLAKIPVGEHPNQMAVHPTDERIFVACASSNCVSVIDAKRGIVAETIYTSLFPNAPEGSTPDAVALTPDGKTLFVANADNNCVALVDVSTPSKSQVKGFIPTGWYPTALATTPDGKSLLVGVGKGNQTHPNPFFDKTIDATKVDVYEAAKREGNRRMFPYIGTTLSGALSIVAIPDEKQLADFTAAVYRNCPYSNKLLTDAPYPRKTAIPTRVGDPSPIQHVIYIIKENRTYDQVFGDMPEGNGDKTLTMFGEEITPNHHKLAREFVLLDNLYCNGQVSRDGHPWSTMAYNTDFIARDWMLTYSRRSGVDDDDEGNLQKAPSGYIWDACARAGLTYRNYGEYGRRVSQADGTLKMEAAVPGLVGHICPKYGLPRVPGARARDTDNVEIFLEEFRKFEATDTLPRMIVMSLGEDHTSGTTVGAFTPQACVASNDLALGRLVEAVSKSKYWPKIAIFVIEDDAQNGPDHVDAHRTVGLVISPYVRRKTVDSTQYSTVSMIRTMELILGLPPLSQFDAAARPMFESFTDTPDLTPYASVPNRIDLNAKNTALAYGAERSNKMDFSEYDRIDDFELNEILWHAIKGKDAPMPPAVRRAVALRLSNTSRKP